MTLSLPNSLTRPSLLYQVMGKLFVTLTFKSVNEILWCDHLNESSLVGSFLLGTFYLKEF